MKLKLEFKGRDDPFEGDRTLHLKTIPEGAQISSARVIVKPQQCVETITFRNGTGDWGATRESGTLPRDSNGNNPRWTAVDLHARRRVSRVRARSETALAGGNPVAIQVNVGGLWTRLAGDGSISSEGENDTFQITLLTTFETFNLPPVIVQGVKLQHDTRAMEISQLTILSHPTNLSLTLGQTPSFWVRPGELTEVETSAEFADVLQAFLAEAEVVNGFYDVPLVVHSDSIACLDLTMELEYVQEQSVLPPGVTDTKLPFKHNGLAEAESGLLQIEVPVGSHVVPGKTTGQVIGAFEDSRVVHGPLGEVTPVAAVSVLTNQSQAQPILLEEDVAATAVDLLLAAVTTTAELDLMLLEDTDGKPGSTPIFATPATISLDSDIAGTPTWISTSLPAEYQFEKGDRVWLVLHARRGEVRWSADTDAESSGMQFTDNGGLSWRQTVVPDVADPLAGLFRLRHRPSRFQMPIELQVGNGKQAERVSLDRFAPTGRVDFSLDFDEVAQAINRHLESIGTGPGSAGEHLENRDFEAWVTSSTPIGEPAFTDLDSEPTAVAVGSDCCWIFVGREPVYQGRGIFQFVDFLTETPDAELEMEEEPIQIIVHPNNTRAYVVIQNSSGEAELQVIDTTEKKSVIGNSSLHLNSTVSNLVISPDGSQLHLSFRDDYNESFVRTIDTGALELALTKGYPEIDDVVTGEGISVGTDLMIEAMVALSSDGTLLYVATGTDPNEGEIHVIDTLARKSLGKLAEIHGRPERIALTPDGTELIVSTINNPYVENTGKIHVVNTGDGSQKTVEGITLNNSRGIVVSLDSTRAFVIDNGQQRILVIDIAARTLAQSIQLHFNPRDIAISPQGDRLFTIGTVSNDGVVHQLVSVPIGFQRPEEWTLSGGAVMPCSFSETFKRVPILGLSAITRQVTPNASSLSQVVPVNPSNVYDFSFWGRALDVEASAEVIWLSDGCGPIQTDEVAIDVYEPESDQTKPIPPEIVLHRARLTSPEGATQAEIRFVTSPNSIAIVDKVSFVATREVVTNSDLRFAPEDTLGNWSVSPKNAPGFSHNIQEDSVLVVNTGTSALALVQTFSVTGEQPFVLAFHGLVPESATTPPRLELHWFDADDNPVGAVSALEISPAGAEHTTLRGSVPATAMEAELHLVLPGKTRLSVSQISFVPVELITVPLNFIAHAPGELTISDFRVAFDLAAATKLPTPAAGLCRPTPVGKNPGCPPDDCCFCPICGGEKHLHNPQSTATPANRPATVGTCPDCGTELVQPGGQISTARIATQPIHTSAPTIRARRTNLSLAAVSTTANRNQILADPPPIMPMESDIAALLPLSPIEWAELAGNPEAEIFPPLTKINGIGEVRMKVLASLGIETIPHLAKAPAEDLASKISGVSRETATGMVAEAKAVEARQAPLVSCVMATYNRRLFVPQAILYFLHQDYPNRELIIVDDGTDPIKDLVPDNAQIQYIRLDNKLSVGAKQNIACEHAHGEILAIWDDDVWVDYWRLSYQVASLLKAKADICGLNNLLHYDVITNQAWRSVPPTGKQPWMPGATLCFTKNYWQKNPFTNISLGEDIRFIRSDPSAKVLPLQAINFQVDIIHTENTSPKNTDSKWWYPYPVQEIQGLMGGDWSLYLELSQLISL